MVERLKSKETGFPYIPLTTPLTSTAWDGNDTKAVGTVTIDTSADFGARPGIRAAALYFGATWVLAANGSAMAIRATGQAVTYGLVRAQVANIKSDGFCIVACDANGDFDVAVLGVQATLAQIIIVGIVGPLE